MKGLMTAVTNTMDGKRYFVSTVKSPRRAGLPQAAVFRKIFGPFANFWRPQAIFVGDDAAYLHRCVTEIARDLDPVEWDDKEVFISADAMRPMRHSTL